MIHTTGCESKTARLRFAGLSNSEPAASADLQPDPPPENGSKWPFYDLAMRRLSTGCTNEETSAMMASGIPLILVSAEEFVVHSTGSGKHKNGEKI